MYGVAALLLLYWDKTERLGVMLGLLMVGMVTLFLIVVASMGLDWAKYEVAVTTAAKTRYNIVIPIRLVWGFIPNIPAKTEHSAEPADIIIRLVSTTTTLHTIQTGQHTIYTADLASFWFIILTTRAHPLTSSRHHPPAAAATTTSWLSFGFQRPHLPNFELFWSAAVAAAGLGCLSRRVCAVKPKDVVNVFGRCRPMKTRRRLRV